MSGYTATGKSTLSKRISHIPNTEIFHSAIIRRELNLTPKNKKEADKFFDYRNGLRKETDKRVYKKLAEMTENSLQEGKNVILDAGYFFGWQREMIYPLAEKFGAEVIVLRAVCPNEEIIKIRLKLRGENYNESALNETPSWNTYLATKEITEEVEKDNYFKNSQGSIYEFDTLQNKLNICMNKNTNNAARIKKALQYGFFKQNKNFNLEAIEKKELSQMIKNQFVIAIDFDGVITSPFKLKAKYLNELGLNLKEDQCQRKDCLKRGIKLEDYKKKSIQAYTSPPQNLPLQEDFCEILDKIKNIENSKIFIVTSRYDQMVKHLEEYLKYHKIKIGGVINTNKSEKLSILKMINAKIFIDDDIEILKQIIDEESSPSKIDKLIFYKNAGNKSEQKLSTFVEEVNNWSEVWQRINYKIVKGKSLKKIMKKSPLMNKNKNAIILAAGLGTRMEGKGKIIPKCLIEINNKTLLERKIELLKKNKIEDISVVIGSKGECWNQKNVDKIRKICDNLIINFDNNITNNTYSLLLGLREIPGTESDILIIDGDLIFDAKTLKEILSHENKTIILSEKQNVGAPGNRVMIDTYGKVLEVGREINVGGNNSQMLIYSGIMQIAQKDFKKFKEECKKEEYYNKDTGLVLNECCKQFPIYSITPDSKWANINNPSDLKKIEEIIAEKDKENILVTGASGFLGKKIFDKMSKEHNIYGTYSSNKKSGEFIKVDITDRTSLKNTIKKVNPKIIIHTAAICNADFCEENREIAHEVNVNGTQNIIDICKEQKIKLIFLSSDYIYEGEREFYEESSLACPVNYYGETKLLCEKMIKNQLKDFIILRPTILYGFNGPEDKTTYVNKVLKKLKNKEEIFVDNFTMKYPLLIDDLVDFIELSVLEEYTGDFNIGPSQGYTRYEWARKIAEIFELDSRLIKPEKSQNIAKKPQNVLYKSEKSEVHQFKIKNLEEGLKMMQKQRGCMFSLIYNSRPDKKVNDESVALFRIEVGKKLAKDFFVKAEKVIGIPDSGIYGALGYAEESKIPIHFGIVKDEYSRRTLINSNPQLRSEKVREKLTVVPEVVRGQDIILVDEAILSGKTLKVAIEKLREAGAGKIHVRIPSPIMSKNCNNNILKRDAALLVKEDIQESKAQVEEKLAEYFGVESLRFLSLESFLESLQNKQNYFCFECFKGKDL
ncbi:sugar nucleotide-binding protein [archaeon]|nr:sugar nucleotide-binding protein [archaeon]